MLVTIGLGDRCSDYAPELGSGCGGCDPTSLSEATTRDGTQGRTNEATRYGTFVVSLYGYFSHDLSTVTCIFHSPGVVNPCGPLLIPPTSLYILIESDVLLPGLALLKLLVQPIYSRSRGNRDPSPNTPLG